jgi:hypothetical protein
MGGVDKKQFFIIFYPHASTYLPTYLLTYLVATKNEVGIRNCTKSRVSKLIIMIMKPFIYPVSMYNHGSQKNQILNYYYNGSILNFFL